MCKYTSKDYTDGFTYLLTDGDSNAKTAKGGEGLMPMIMHLSPHTIADRGNVCPWASKGCAAACLNTSGRSQTRLALEHDLLVTTPIHAARIKRTQLFFDNRQKFMGLLFRELELLTKRATKSGDLPVVRLNGTSDIPWEGIRYEGKTVFEAFPGITFYDYTKGLERALRPMPVNYHLTFSRSEETGPLDIMRALEAGINVAVVFEAGDLPTEWAGFEVIDGLEHDFRFKDPKGVIVGLTAKARAKKDETGFVINPLATLLAAA